MWEPMFPRPRNAMFIVCPYLVDDEIIDALDRCKKCLYCFIGDICELLRIPSWGPVFIDDLGTYTFGKIDAFHSMHRGSEVLHQYFSKAQIFCSSYRLQGDFQSGR